MQPTLEKVKKAGNTASYTTAHAYFLAIKKKKLKQDRNMWNVSVYLPYPGITTGSNTIYNHPRNVSIYLHM